MTEPTDAKPFAGAWFFEEFAQAKMLRAVEPDGTEHIIKLGDMNSLAGIRLLNAMVRDLTQEKKP